MWIMSGFSFLIKCNNLKIVTISFPIFMSRVRYEILIVRIFFSVSLLKSSSPSQDTPHTSNWSVGRFVAKLYTYLWAPPQLAFVIRYNILCLIGFFFILIIIPFVPTHFIAHFYML